MSGARVDHGFSLIMTHKQCFVITALMQVLIRKVIICQGLYKHKAGTH